MSVVMFGIGFWLVMAIMLRTSARITTRDMRDIHLGTVGGF